MIFSLDIVSEIRSERSLEEPKQLKALINKKLNSITIPNNFEKKLKTKSKLINFLASKGYSYDQIEAAINDYL